jgi:hypothetical protein
MASPAREMRLSSGDPFKGNPMSTNKVQWVQAQAWTIANLVMMLLVTAVLALMSVV